MERMTRKQAIEAGLEFYYTGKPCKRGHLAERETLTASCMECRRMMRGYIISKQNERKQREAAAVAETV